MGWVVVCVFVCYLEVEWIWYFYDSIGDWGGYGEFCSGDGFCWSFVCDGGVVFFFLVWNELSFDWYYVCGVVVVGYGVYWFVGVWEIYVYLFD